MNSKCTPVIEYEERHTADAAFFTRSIFLEHMISVLICYKISRHFVAVEASFLRCCHQRV